MCSRLHSVKCICLYAYAWPLTIQSYVIIAWKNLKCILNMSIQSSNLYWTPNCTASCCWSPNRNQRIDLTTVNNWPYLSNNFIYWYLNFISATPAVFVCLPAYMLARKLACLPAGRVCLFLPFCMNMSTNIVCTI